MAISLRCEIVMYCTRCGKEGSSDSDYCLNCGALLMNMVMKRDALQVLGECAGLHPVDLMKKTRHEYVNKYLYASQNMLFDAS